MTGDANQPPTDAKPQVAAGLGNEAAAPGSPTNTASVERAPAPPPADPAPETAAIAAPLPATAQPARRAGRWKGHVASAAKRTFSRLGVVPRSVEHFRTIIGNVLLSIVLVGLVFVSWRVFRDDDIIIEPIGVPESFVKDGYTPAVAAARLRNALLVLRDYQHGDANFIFGERMRLPVRSGSGASEGLPNVEVHGVGLSINQLIQNLREGIRGQGPRISGQLIFESEKLCLHLHYNSAEEDRRRGPPIRVCDPRGTDIEQLFERGARLLLLEISPEVALRQPSDDPEVERHIGTLIGALGRSDKIEDRALSFELLARGWSNGGNAVRALHWIERAHAAAPLSRRAATIALYQYTAIGQQEDDELKAADKDAGRAAKVRGDATGRIEQAKTRAAQALDRYGSRTSNLVMLVAALEIVLANRKERLAVSAAAAAREALAREVAGLRRAAMRRLGRVEQPDADVLSLMFVVAVALGEMKEAARHCTAVDRARPFGAHAMRCRLWLFTLERAKLSAADVAGRYGALLERFVTTVSYILPDDANEARIQGLENKIARYRLRSERRALYGMLFDIFDSSRLARIASLKAQDPASAGESADNLMHITLWTLARLECIVFRDEDDPGLAELLAEAYDKHGFPGMRAKFAELAKFLRDKREIEKTMDIRLRRGNLSKEAESQDQPDQSMPIAAPRALMDWRKERCALRNKWEAHPTVRAILLRQGG
ncbi:MAG TPA: hypothetical protein VIF14_08655 [Alphaproteobacteria bacterium]|jgi:hypothetical protein